MPRDAVSRTANVGTSLQKRNGGNKWVKPFSKNILGNGQAFFYPVSLFNRDQDDCKYIFLCGIFLPRAFQLFICINVCTILGS